MLHIMGGAYPTTKTIQQPDLAKRYIHFVMRAVATDCHRDPLRIQKVENRIKVWIWLQIFSNDLKVLA